MTGLATARIEALGSAPNRVPLGKWDLRRQRCVALAAAPGGGIYCGACLMPPLLTEISHQEHPQDLDILRHSVRTRDGPGRYAIVRRRATGLRADRRRRLLLRLRHGAEAFGGRFPQDRGRDGPHHQGRRALRAGRNGPPRSDPTLPRSGPIAEGRAPERRPGRGAHGFLLSAGRVLGSLPRSARGQRGRDRRIQAALDSGRILEGRRLAATVAAALRHGLLHPESTSTII